VRITYEAQADAAYIYLAGVYDHRQLLPQALLNVAIKIGSHGI
jgi:hypothetical protein